MQLAGLDFGRESRFTPNAMLSSAKVGRCWHIVKRELQNILGKTDNEKAEVLVGCCCGDGAGG